LTFRAQRTYAYVLVNAVVHSGIYTWLGLYLRRRYGLGEAGIGLATACPALRSGPSSATSPIAVAVPD
jgi:hypothetical protein